MNTLVAVFTINQLNGSSKLKTNAYMRGRQRASQILLAFAARSTCTLLNASQARKKLACVRERRSNPREREKGYFGLFKKNSVVGN